MPEWMQEAILYNVLEVWEAQEIHRLALESEQEEVPMPEHLWPAMERIHLWEAPPASPSIH